ncbi:hypothetical protein ES332_A10G107400v1 [Gossypium tomentosum]|uniref:Uncharacterized protein n=1 Tax=Gossypium tomentosum TaxID=34277 RepID=A0A5D2NPP3_GOSTO|nr:hypothetical protein ES332_A10G107400v1 [Gossypium tomentosum]
MVLLPLSHRILTYTSTITKPARIQGSMSRASCEAYGGVCGTRCRAYKGRSWRSYGAEGWGLAAAQEAKTLGFLFLKYFGLFGPM